jgi:hypothetical protein
MPVTSMKVMEGTWMRATASLEKDLLTARGKVVTLRDANFSTQKTSSLNVQLEPRMKTGNCSLI